MEVYAFKKRKKKKKDHTFNFQVFFFLYTLVSEKNIKTLISYFFINSGIEEAFSKFYKTKFK